MAHTDEIGYHSSWDGQNRLYPQTWKLWALIEQHPGASLRELTVMMGFSNWSSLATHIQRLREWGVLANQSYSSAKRTLVCLKPYAVESYLSDEERHVMGNG